MEKVVIIKEAKEDSSYNLLKIINYLVYDCSKINCSFLISDAEYSLTNDFKETIEFDNWIETSKRKIIGKCNTEIEFTVNKEQLNKVVHFVKKYNYNLIIKCRNISFDINDNDGDLIILNTKDNDYKKMKKIIEANNL